jgi:hypothetical protein
MSGVELQLLEAVVLQIVPIKVDDDSSVEFERTFGVEIEASQVEGEVVASEEVQVGNVFEHKGVDAGRHFDQYLDVSGQEEGLFFELEKLEHTHIEEEVVEQVALLQKVLDILNFDVQETQGFPRVFDFAHFGSQPLGSDEPRNDYFFETVQCLPVHCISVEGRNQLLDAFLFFFVFQGSFRVKFGEADLVDPFLGRPLIIVKHFSFLGDFSKDDFSTHELVDLIRFPVPRLIRRKHFELTKRNIKLQSQRNTLDPEILRSLVRNRRGGAFFHKNIGEVVDYVGRDAVVDHEEGPGLKFSVVVKQGRVQPCCFFLEAFLKLREVEKHIEFFPGVVHRTKYKFFKLFYFWFL